jgi:predicted glutamine amidotransferase
MCQLCAVNAGSELLNKELLLVAGSLGSIVHDDGWGIFNGETWWKCAMPMHLTSNAGSLVKEKLPKGRKPIFLHIRQASPLVPVITANAHPFADGDFTFAHNGKLTPKEEKNFVMEEEVPDIDDKTGQQKVDVKTGELKTKMVKRSDSLIFFEELMQVYTEISEKDTGNKLDSRATMVKALKDTMEKFTGKFAFLISDGTDHYVVRGRTADLYVSYLRQEASLESTVYGFMVDTGKDVLSEALGLVSNLRQLRGDSPLHYSYPAMLENNSIFVLEKAGLTRLAPIYENSATVYSTPWTREGVSGGRNFTPDIHTKAGETSKANPDELEKLHQRIFTFMTDYCLSPWDIQNLFLAYYDASLEEVTMPILRHFVKKEIPNLCSRVRKAVRKDMKKIIGNSFVPTSAYEQGDQYPWIFQHKNAQASFIKRLSKSRVVV